jgi:hypothetical protein
VAGRFFSKKKWPTQAKAVICQQGSWLKNLLKVPYFGINNSQNPHTASASSYKINSNPNLQLPCHCAAKCLEAETQILNGAFKKPRNRARPPRVGGALSW